jgi:hypothetical protein
VMVNSAPSRANERTECVRAIRDSYRTAHASASELLLAGRAYL